MHFIKLSYSLTCTTASGIQECQKQWSHLFTNTLFVANLVIHAKQHFLSRISNNAPNARIEGIFAFFESLTTSATLPCINFDRSIHSIQQSNNLSKIQNDEWRGDGRVTGQGNDRTWILSKLNFFRLTSFLLWIFILYLSSPPSFLSPSSSSSLSTRVSTAISGVSGYRHSALCWTHAPLKAI